MIRGLGAASGKPDARVRSPRAIRSPPSSVRKFEQEHSMAIHSRRLMTGIAAAVLASAASAQVQAFVASGKLHVIGSSGPDGVQLSALDGTVRVSGLGGTLVNGAPSATLTGIVGEIAVSLGGGDDFLMMTDSQTLAGVSIELGGGDDTLFATRNLIRGDWVLHSGAAGPGGDLLALAGADQVGNVVLGSLFVVGNGLTLGLRGHTVSQDVVVNTGARNDKLLISGNNVAGSMVLQTRGGRDEIAFASEVGVAGNFVGGSLSIQAGAGDDLVHLGDVANPTNDVGSRSAILAGVGADTVTVRNTLFHDRVVFRGGSHFDVLEAQALVFGNTYARGVVQHDFESVQ
jgi:hypothetical protein